MHSIAIFPFQVDAWRGVYPNLLFRLWSLFVYVVKLMSFVIVINLTCRAPRILILFVPCGLLCVYLFSRLLMNICIPYLLPRFERATKGPLNLINKYQIMPTWKNATSRMRKFLNTHFLKHLRDTFEKIKLPMFVEWQQIDVRNYWGYMKKFPMFFIGKDIKKVKWNNCFHFKFAHMENLVTSIVMNDSVHSRSLKGTEPFALASTRDLHAVFCIIYDTRIFS